MWKGGSADKVPLVSECQESLYFKWEKSVGVLKEQKPYKGYILIDD